MSNINNNNFEYQLHSEQHDEVIKRVRSSIFVAQVGSLAANLGVFALFRDDSGDVPSYGGRAQG